MTSERESANSIAKLINMSPKDNTLEFNSDEEPL